MRGSPSHPSKSHTASLTSHKLAKDGYPPMMATNALPFLAIIAMLGFLLAEGGCDIVHSTRKALESISADSDKTLPIARTHNT